MHRNSNFPGEVRIIGGQWKGRKIKIASHLPCRPTTNRIRETLFNWLAPVITNSRCLDVFSGCGALSFEAISRGAATVTAWDCDRSILQHLEHYKKIFATEKLIASTMQLPVVPMNPDPGYNIIFLDPPYQCDLLLPTLKNLLSHRYIQQDSLIYYEHPREEIIDWNHAAELRTHRQQYAGNVCYGLLKFCDNLAENS